jgi:hypothetical protein
LFVKNTPSLLKKFDVCLETNNFTGLKLYAHKLRSSVKIIGMNSTDEILKTIEDDINNGTLNKEEFAERIKVVQASCNKAMSELKDQFNLE